MATRRRTKNAVTLVDSPQAQRICTLAKTLGISRSLLAEAVVEAGFEAGLNGHVEKVLRARAEVRAQKLRAALDPKIQQIYDEADAKVAALNVPANLAV